jgi:hypothetical protein
MKVVNWLELRLQETELNYLIQNLNPVMAARKVGQLLVKVILDQYPWENRKDLIDVFHPTRKCQKGEWLAWIKKDVQALRPPTWVLGHIMRVEKTENPIQGKFQVITIEFQGKSRQFAAGITAAQWEDPDFSDLQPEEWDVLATQIADFYSETLQSTLERLCQLGQLPGHFVGETFVHNTLPVISTHELSKYFNRLSLDMPWLYVKDLLKLLRVREDLKDLADDILIPMIRSALEISPFQDLGFDRWTTAEIFDQLNRDVPRGLPVPHIRSKLDIWTEADQQDLSDIEDTFIPGEVLLPFDIEDDYEPSATEQRPWEPPTYPIRLPTFSYLHLTQAYFPIGKVVSAFPPDVHLVLIQIIQGDYQPFLVDRHLGVLKAMEIENFRIACLESGIPAGTYLWLEYQGDDNYRIVPHPLPAPHVVQCKLAFIEDGSLKIEHTEIWMEYDGDPLVFKAELRFSDIDALFEEARLCQLSVFDAIIRSIQELCAVDPNGSANRFDIFNAVYLKRMCSPNSVNVLLYSKPCFIHLDNNYFQYDPTAVQVVSAQGKQIQIVTSTVNYEAVVNQLVITESTTLAEEKLESMQVKPTLPTSELEASLSLSQTSDPTVQEIGFIQSETTISTSIVRDSAAELKPPLVSESEAPTNIIKTEAVQVNACDLESAQITSTEEIVNEKPSELNEKSNRTISIFRHIWHEVHDRVSMIWRSLWRKYGK